MNGSSSNYVILSVLAIGLLLSTGISLPVAYGGVGNVINCPITDPASALFGGSFQNCANIVSGSNQNVPSDETPPPVPSSGSQTPSNQNCQLMGQITHCKNQPAYIPSNYGGKIDWSNGANGGEGGSFNMDAPGTTCNEPKGGHGDVQCTYSSNVPPAICTKNTGIICSYSPSNVGGTLESLSNNKGKGFGSSFSDLSKLPNSSSGGKGFGSSFSDISKLTGSNSGDNGPRYYHSSGGGNYGYDSSNSGDNGPRYYHSSGEGNYGGNGGGNYGYDSSNSGAHDSGGWGYRQHVWDNGFGGQGHRFVGGGDFWHNGGGGGFHHFRMHRSF